MPFGAMPQTFGSSCEHPKSNDGGHFALLARCRKVRRGSESAVRERVWAIEIVEIDIPADLSILSLSGLPYPAVCTICNMLQ
jgi:hypothetical protein